ncbi:MAG: cytochrome P450 [Pseudomonadota bacterium]
MNGSRIPTVYPVGMVVRAMLRGGERDMLALLPNGKHNAPMTRIGHTRRGIYLVDDPALIREIMVERVEAFPKNDLFNQALSPLIGDGVFIADGAQWEAQRKHLEPSIRFLRSGEAKSHLNDAAGAACDRLSGIANAAVDLGRFFSAVTADVMHRLLFGTPLDGAAATKLHHAFSRFQKDVAAVRLSAILLKPPFRATVQKPSALQAAQTIREYLRAQIAQTHAAANGPGETLTSLITHHAPDGADDDWVLNQVAVYFLAGHETTASTMTWATLLLAGNAHWSEQWITGDRPVRVAIIKEVMRLYPAGVFLPRVARDHCRLGSFALRRGNMLLISPWRVHRNANLWPEPERFDPARFMKGAPTIPAGAYLPFGLGARTCIGGAFSFLEADTVLGALFQRFDVKIMNTKMVAPRAGLTLSTMEPIMANLRPKHWVTKVSTLDTFVS